MDILIIAIIIAAVVAVIAGLILRANNNQKNEQALRERFGPEYHRAREREGSDSDAMDELRRRERRVERFELTDLEEADRNRFAQRWQQCQAAFVDGPADALNQADDLVGEVMTARGYPMEDFEERAADLSVSYPELVSNYRLGHQIAVSNQRGEADTEALRQAFIHYRAMFTELLGPVAEPANARR